MLHPQDLNAMTMNPGKITSYIAVLAVVALSSCATAPRTTTQARTAVLRLVVTPNDAEVYIDDTYQGVVAGWREGIIALTPGNHRVTLVAPAHLTERFDLRMRHREELTLTVDLEPELALPDDPNQPVTTSPLSPKKP